MNKLLQFLENNWKRHFLWAGVVIVVFAIYIFSGIQIPSATFTLLLVLLVVVLELTAGYFLKRARR